MHIAMVGPFGLRVKGTMSARALPLARALVRRGHRLRIVMPPWDSPADSGQAWQDAGVEVEHISLAGAAGRWAPARIGQRLARAALRDDPDLLHLFKPVGYTGVLAMGVRRKRRRPALLFDLDDLEGLRGWGQRASRWEGWIREFQERWAVQHADGLTVASRYLRSLALAAGAPAGRIAWLPNGCEAEGSAVGTEEWHQARSMERDRLGIPPDAPAFFWSTRFIEADLQRIRDLLGEILDGRPAARVLIVGAGPAGQEVEWKRLTASLPSFRERALVLGWLPLAQWRAAALAADLALLPLDDTDINRARCPSTIPRLMALGLPLVLEDVGEASTYVEDGRTGRLVPAGVAGAFTRAVDELLSRPGARMEMGRAAADAALSQWNWERLAGIAETAYLNALQDLAE